MDSFQKNLLFRNWLQFFQKWHHCYDNLIDINVIYTDIDKAFDTVSHSKIITILKVYGIGGSVLMWIKEFLHGRSQHVCVNNVFSNFLDVSSGVPQGSVLGPLLFNIYINDLVSNCTVSGNFNDVILYADDTKLFGNDNVMLQNNLDKAESFFNSR